MQSLPDLSMGFGRKIRVQATFVLTDRGHGPYNIKQEGMNIFKAAICRRRRNFKKGGSMAFESLQWDETLRVGVEEIDAQHRKLFDLLNSLGRAVEKGYEKDVIGHVLFEMAAYADEHFKSEQLYLEKHPDFREHFLEHWEFTKKCLALVMDFRRNRQVSDETLAFLMAWLKDHVMEKDQRFFRELADQGLLL